MARAHETVLKLVLDREETKMLERLRDLIGQASPDLRKASKKRAFMVALRIAIKDYTGD